MDESERFPVVGIGASAGGLEALEALFRSMPADSGMSFVIVTHLGPGSKSALPEILQRSTAMPVAAATDNVELAPNQIYVMPPATILTVKEGRLQLRPDRDGEHERNPVDVFFAALAEDRTEDAIGIVLSGGGADGALGIRAIKERGGLTLAQGTDGSGPRHESMPHSAIATGAVDIVVPVEEMPRKVADYVRSMQELHALAGHETEQRKLEAARLTICQLLRKQVGHDFSGYKPTTFMRRVRRRMHVLQLASLDLYVERLHQDATELSLLFRDLLIGVTSFFRDPDAFVALKSEALPQIFSGRDTDDTIRVWVPGCATGDEVYSLAMMLREQTDGLASAPRVQIFATDIDESALAVARAGRYPASMLNGVSPERRRRFFVASGASYVVTKEIRDLCMFSPHNVIRDPPFSRIDLVSCRNLLIYLGGDVQGQLMSVFHYALRPGGYLFLGTAENIAQHADLFQQVDKKQRLYKRRDTPATIPVLATGGPAPGGATRLRGGIAGNGRAADRASLRQLIEARVLEHFAPPHVVVDGEGEILYYSARTGRYLEAPAGTPSRELVAIARPGLRPELRAALREVAETHRPVRREGVGVEIDDQLQTIALVIDMVPNRPEDDPWFLVLFLDSGPMMKLDEGLRGQHPQQNNVIDHLEQELRETRERLQTTVEEYETALEELKSSNEELVSLNEELQSSNEEMETSKEELQSVNEELETVNLQLHGTIEELGRANGDLRNLFESTRIATVFLDRHFVIRSFTPAVAEVFNLIPSDRGRPLSDITCHLEPVDFRGYFQQVLDRREAVEQAVSRRDGRAHYLMRILPYRTGEDEVDGILVTFADVTNIVAAEQHNAVLVAELNHRVRNLLQVVTTIADLTLKDLPDETLRTFTGRLRAMANSYELLSRRDWTDVRLRELVVKELEIYAPAGSVEADGPAVLLTAPGALAVGMVLHELATNAVKYGALSVEGGRVGLGWTVLPGDKPQLRLEWCESRGPPVTAPAAPGFGSRLLQREIEQELGGTISRDFRPDGLRVTLLIPSSPLWSS